MVNENLVPSAKPTPAGGPSRRTLLTGGLVLVGGAATAGTVLATSSARPRPASAANPLPAEAPSGRSETASVTAPAYLGYRRSDYAQPWGKYFTERTSPVQAHVRKALAAGPVSAAHIPSLAQLREEMRTPGYSPIETGWGTLPGGTLWTAVLTDMPRVAPHMWDWWFGWHSSHSSRYKLWHPEAHLHAALLHDRAADPGLSDKQRYIGNTSYVDEYLPDYRSGYEYLGSKAGGLLVQLGISFVEPGSAGFATSAFDGTIIVGRAGPQGQAQTVGVLCHQVRVTRNGSEMRSRFYQPAEPRNDIRPADPAAAAAVVARGPLPQLAAPQQACFLMLHCAQAMNHLATFLPELYREFGQGTTR